MNTEFFVGLISFVLTVLLMPIFIQTYNKAKISGQQMHEDVKQHQAKAGTPTMGGIVFLLVGSLVALLGLLWSGRWTASAGMVLLILVLYGLVGFLDDFLKLAHIYVFDCLVFIVMIPVEYMLISKKKEVVNA